MRSLLAALLFWSGCLTGAFAQQDADNRYLAIYAQIQQANTLHNNGSLPEALAAYATAQSQLLDFQKSYPAWYTDIVAYRLSDLADKIATLRAQLPPPAALVIPAAPPNASASPPAPVGNDASVQLWQQQLQALKDDNARLQAKLQEALSLQSPAANADDLAKANSEIRELMKDNALLEISHRPAEPGPSQADYTALKEQFKESEKKRAAQRTAIEKLKGQNHALQSDLDHAAKSNDDLTARVREEDQQLQSRLEAMQATLKAASQEKNELQGRVKQLMSELIRTDRRFEASIYILTAQRDALAQQLKTAAPGGAPEQTIEITTTPAADQIRPPLPPPAFTLAALQTSPAAINPAPGQWPASEARLAASVQEHFARHEFSLAGADARELLQLDPKNNVALANLAAIEFEQNHLAEAQKHITAALDLNTDDAASLALRGKIEYARGDDTAALMDLFQSAQLEPGNAGTQNDLGLTMNRLGQRDAAQDAFNKAVQLDPHSVIAQDNLALFYLSQNPPNAQLVRWHYQRAREAGGARNPDLEKWLNQNGAPVAFLSGSGKN